MCLRNLVAIAASFPENNLVVSWVNSQIMVNSQAASTYTKEIWASGQVKIQKYIVKIFLI
ncbi:hypothetical protein [Nostoc sp.]|uniref:hypothetical protein n=1 Tax=Nostoc sp. TaxID=1180 RepID=UPI002FF50710